MRLIFTFLLQVIANAIGLVVAAALLENMTLSVSGFLIAVGIFTLISLIVSPMLRQAALKNSPALLGSTALIVSLIALIGTTLVSDALEISGFSTWILATVAIWAASLAATALLPFVIFKRLRESK